MGRKNKEGKVVIPDKVEINAKKETKPGVGYGKRPDGEGDKPKKSAKSNFSIHN